MENKFLTILDSEKQRSYHNVLDLYNIMSFCNYQYVAEGFTSDLFCGEFNSLYHLQQQYNIEDPSFFDPIKKTRKLFKLESQLYPQTKSVNDISRRNEKKKYQINIDVNIDSISDLIDIINKYTIDIHTEYNIDLKSLHKIKTELVQLNNMIGLQDFKKQILNQLLYFIQELHIGIESDFMHTVIYGPPGTGKTEIANIIGNMYSKLGILKKNTFKMVNRSDLVAGYLGQTALKTSRVIEESLGGCLFIDEAYALANNYDGDSYSRECIDTLCESLSKHKSNLMVIIAGYKEELEQTFFKANKGLNSRFLWRFHLEKYNHEELCKILQKKITENDWVLNILEGDLIDWFKQNQKDFLYFGRDIELLFSYIKMSHGRRLYGKPKDERKKINIQDLTKGFELFKEHRGSNKKEKTVLYGMYV